MQCGKYCYITGKTNCQLHKHHIFNGPLRNWSDHTGLWIYLAYDMHIKLHESNTLSKELKRVAQYIYEKDHTRLEFYSNTHKNYLQEPLTDEEKRKYHIEVEELDLNELIELDKILVRS